MPTDDSGFDRRERWQPAPRPEWVSRLNEEGEILNSKSIVPLDENSLLAEARSNTGLSDFGDDGWIDHFRVLIRAIEEDRMDRAKNPLKLAPHSALDITDVEWDRPYDRNVAAFPASNLRDSKYWPPVSRIDNAFGDRNLVCTCPSVEEMAE